MAFKVKLLINGESVDGDGDSLAVQNPRLDPEIGWAYVD